MLFALAPEFALTCPSASALHPLALTLPPTPPRLPIPPRFAAVSLRVRLPPSPIWMRVQSQFTIEYFVPYELQVTVCYWRCTEVHEVQGCGHLALVNAKGCACTFMGNMHPERAALAWADGDMHGTTTHAALTLATRTPILPCSTHPLSLPAAVL